jgi:[acyl-carrier-protein] S-malonyltransferase
LSLPRVAGHRLIAMPAVNGLRSRISNAAFAFRGYNTTNLGRTPALLAHRVYGPVVHRHLAQLGTFAADVLHRRIDLVGRVRDQVETRDLGSYAEDVALIVAVELAQLRLLEEFHGIAIQNANHAFGYSLGEAAALVATGVFEAEQLMLPPLLLADDCAALAESVTLGVLFSRGQDLDLGEVKRLCLEITQEGRGVIAISTYLSPNTVLLLGQNGTLDGLRRRMKDVLRVPVQLRKNPHRWPPLHTPITWQRSIPNRCAVLYQTQPGGFSEPCIPVFSCVTGKPSYDSCNARELLHRWTDMPQRLWEVVYETLASGVETVLHLGPGPNLIPATFHRLSENVKAQLAARSWRSLGLRAAAHMIRRPWLQRILSAKTALLRAPFIEHVIVEDWLLEQKP